MVRQRSAKPLFTGSIPVLAFDFAKQNHPEFLVEELIKRGARHFMWNVYILKCSDDSYYTGVTSDLDKRLVRHNLGQAVEYTKLRRPVELLYVEEFENKKEALKREVQIKKYGRKNKEHLIQYGHGQNVPSSQQIKVK